MNGSRRYERLAPLYDLLDLAEVLYKRPLRRRAFAGLTGTILDAGAGTLRNLPYYPPDTAVVALDLSPAMLQRARRRHEQAGRPVALVAMDLCRAGFSDDCFDAIVATFVFSGLPEAVQGPALAELARLCKPAGEIRILDYRLSRHWLRRPLMRLWQIWEQAVYGCTFDRQTERYLAPAGLELLAEEFLLYDVVRLLRIRPGCA